MKKQINILPACAVLVLFLTMAGCKKDDKVYPAPELATFLNKSSGSYFVTGPDISYTIPVGITTTSDHERTINISVSSTTGAVEGTQYTLTTKSIKIPAGKVLDSSLVLQGKFDVYEDDARRDTLIFTITSAGVTPSDYNNKFTLLMRGPCQDYKVEDLDVMSGDYEKTFEDGGYGPYTSSITNIQTLTPTTGTAKINKLYESYNGIVINFDWSDPDNVKVVIPEQYTNANHSLGPIYVRTTAGASNTFSVCTQSFNFNIDLLVRNTSGTLLGYIARGYNISMTR